MTDRLYAQALEFTTTRVGFTRQRFQDVMRIGFSKRDQLLLQLIDNGVIECATNDHDYFLTKGGN